MFGRKRESKADMRNGMWQRGPAKRADFGEDRPLRQRGPEIASPKLQPQAEGQTTHE
jgi:hypothetical protein